MFDSIRGTLTRRDPTRVVVEAGGLGYEVQVASLYPGEDPD